MIDEEIHGPETKRSMKKWMAQRPNDDRWRNGWPRDKMIDEEIHGPENKNDRWRNGRSRDEMINDEEMSSECRRYLGQGPWRRSRCLERWMALHRAGMLCPATSHCRSVTPERVMHTGRSRTDGWTLWSDCSPVISISTQQHKPHNQITLNSSSSNESMKRQFKKWTPLDRSGVHNLRPGSGPRTAYIRLSEQVKNTRKTPDWRRFYEWI